MIAGLILSVGSLFFLLLLFVSYFSKQRFISIKNKLKSNYERGKF